MVIDGGGSVCVWALAVMGFTPPFAGRELILDGDGDGVVEWESWLGMAFGDLCSLLSVVISS